MTQEEAEPAKGPDADHQGRPTSGGGAAPGRRERKQPERPSPLVFIGLVIAALATLAAIFSLLINGVRYFSAYLLFAAALILLLALIFTGLSQFKAFQTATSTIIIIALMAWRRLRHIRSAEPALEPVGREYNESAATEFRFAFASYRTVV